VVLRHILAEVGSRPSSAFAHIPKAAEHRRSPKRSRVVEIDSKRLTSILDLQRGGGCA